HGGHSDEELELVLGCRVVGGGGGATEVDGGPAHAPLAVGTGAHDRSGEQVLGGRRIARPSRPTAAPAGSATRVPGPDLTFEGPRRPRESLACRARGSSEGHASQQQERKHHQPHVRCSKAAMSSMIQPVSLALLAISTM